ncbi:MAG: CPBP family intramembrane metalloprotease [Bacteroidetes bacterium]|nr:CPBP family intramembrane metalloprotease [Bacteroidota bacterium]
MQVDSNEYALRPAVSLIFSLLTIFLGFAVIGQTVGLLAGAAFYDGTFNEWTNEFSSELRMSEKIRTPLLVVQGMSTGIGLILVPLLYLKFIEKIKLNFLSKAPNAISISLVALLVMVFMLPDSMIIDWNSNLTLPASFDKWVREREELAAAFTRFITQFKGTGDFLFGMLVIAILPAIGEELAFRGLLQPALNRISGNIHLAVWITAIIFSSFHFQFLGFIPRMLLGALFGYLYAWSGNLWMPIAAHFVNNGLGVLMLYLYQLGLLGFDPESTEAAPIYLALPGAIAFVWLLTIVRKKLSHEHQQVSQQA